MRIATFIKWEFGVSIYSTVSRQTFWYPVGFIFDISYLDLCAKFVKNVHWGRHIFRKTRRINNINNDNNSNTGKPRGSWYFCPPQSLKMRSSHPLPWICKKKKKNHQGQSKVKFKFMILKIFRKVNWYKEWQEQVSPLGQVEY